VPIYRAHRRFIGPLGSCYGVRIYYSICIIAPLQITRKDGEPTAGLGKVQPLLGDDHPMLIRATQQNDESL